MQLFAQHEVINPGHIQRQNLSCYVLTVYKYNPGNFGKGTAVAQYHFWNLIRSQKIMVVYRAKRRNPALKWIIGAIVFIATLCITFNDLYGANLPF